MGQRGAKWKQKRWVFFATGTMAALWNRACVAFQNVAFLCNGTDRHEIRTKSINQCAVLNLNGTILKIFP